MLNNTTKNILLLYINQLINLGIPKDSIYYSDNLNIHLFIFPESLLNEDIYNGIAMILEDSSKYDDNENDIPFMNILPMLDSYIERSNYSLASDVLNIATVSIQLHASKSIISPAFIYKSFPFFSHENRVK